MTCACIQPAAAYMTHAVTAHMIYQLGRNKHVTHISQMIISHNCKIPGDFSNSSLHIDRESTPLTCQYNMHCSGLPCRTMCWSRNSYAHNKCHTTQYGPPSCTQHTQVYGSLTRMHHITHSSDIPPHT